MKVSVHLRAKIMLKKVPKWWLDKYLLPRTVKLRGKNHILSKNQKQNDPLFTLLI